MTVATNFCQSFDSDLKRIRFVTSCIFEGTVGCEFITPLFPQHFLALASIANVGKAIALSAFVSTQPAFQKALCAEGNMADLTAKTQAQHMLVDMISLAVSASVMFAVRGSERGRILLPLALFPLLAAADLSSIFWELKAVELKMLNRERAEMVAERWIKMGKMPLASEISREESLLLPSNVSSGFLPLRVTSVDQVIVAAGGPDSIHQLQKVYGKDNYLLAVKNPVKSPGLDIKCAGGQDAYQGGFWSLFRPKAEVPEALLCLGEDADTSHALRGVLEVAYLRQAFRSAIEKSSRLKAAEEGIWSSAVPLQLLSAAEIDSCRNESHKMARKQVGNFIRQLDKNGWISNKILYNSNEKDRYVSRF